MIIGRRRWEEEEGTRRKRGRGGDGRKRW